MSQAVQYAETHFSEYIEKLKKLVQIPSVSFDGFPKSELTRCAEAVAAWFREDGLENVELLRVGDAFPYVYADWLHAPGKPTLLLYAHYDVQPPGKEALWKSPPFEPQEREGRLYGRGSADDKAGILVHMGAITSYLKTTGNLPVNVKLLIEGEEEVGSIHLEKFLQSYKDKVQADCIIITDSGNFDTGIPTITTSLRGIVATEITVRVMEHSVHSGTWGGPGPDPVIALSKMISSLVDAEGRIAIAGIYNKVRKLAPVEKESLARLNYTDDVYRKQAKLLPTVQIVGGPASPKEKIARLPAVSVNAIQASSRKDVANVVLSEAWCKVGIRTVPDMDGEETERMLKDHLVKNAPWGVEVTFTSDQVAPWWVTSPEHRLFKKAAESLSKSYGKPCVFMGEGGSIPFVGPFSAVLGGVPALLVGVEDPHTCAHSENESAHLGDLKKAIIGAIHFYESCNK